MRYDSLGVESELIELDCKMKIRYCKREGFNRSYVGIGVNYGSKDFNFIHDGVEYKTKSGIAHFIEHKCFSMPDGSDSFYTLSDMGVSANAYTSSNRTVYFFNTVESIYKPLGVLLDTIFTNGFTKENIEHEKGIICSEINMYKSNLDYVLETTTLKNMYLNTGYMYDVAGSVEDVMATTLDDILNNFKAFYHPSNLILDVVGDIDKEELILFVNKYIAKYEFEAAKETKSLDNLTHIEVNEELVEIKGKTEEEKYCLGIRLNNEFTDLIEQTICYDYLLDLISSDSSNIYQKLIKKHIINPDMYYELQVGKDSSFILICGSANDAKLAINKLLEIFNHFPVKEISEESLNSFKKNTLAENIRVFDNISGIGEVLMEYDLAGLNYFDYLPKLRSINLADIKKYAKNISKSKKSSTILTN